MSPDAPVVRGSVAEQAVQYGQLAGEPEDIQVRDALRYQFGVSRSSGRRDKRGESFAGMGGVDDDQAGCWYDRGRAAQVGFYASGRQPARTASKIRWVNWPLAASRSGASSIVAIERLYRFSTSRKGTRPVKFTWGH